MSQADSFFSQKDTPITIPGTQGELEALVLGGTQENKIAIICHPHPLFQGTMHNKVVYTLSRAFHHAGIPSIRFNYRGVGKSEGAYGDSIGEIDDLMSVVAWIEERIPAVEFYFSGFSFGSYIAASGAAMKKNTIQLISIAPSVVNQNYQELPTLHCPWLVIQGENDEVVESFQVYDWYEREKQRHTDLTLIKVPGASHFFHGDLITLRSLIEQNLRK